MAIKTYIDNDCVGCEHCINCGRGDYLALDQLICDVCKESVDKLYQVDGDQLCQSCALETFEVIDDDNWQNFVEG